MLLRDVSEDGEDGQKHYCLHHTHHNMYDCITYRDNYKDLELLPPRANANCYKHSLEKKVNPRTNLISSCFGANEKFPPIE